tara:strand:+ start:258 stop:482 length:225 start_codon:yes stop_codon:yes gene_type:complete
MPFIKGRKESSLFKSPPTLTPNLERKKIATADNLISMTKNGKDFSNDLTLLYAVTSITLSSLFLKERMLTPNTK